MHDTLPLLGPSSFPTPSRRKLQTLQINIGYRCNLACLHCHVNSSPYRKEQMDDGTIELVLEFLRNNSVSNLDITGGAPEMHPRFKGLVRSARDMGVHIMDRCNLTILLEKGYEDLCEFLAANEVEIIASLPCYQEENVDSQRGKGVYQDSIRALKKLNEAGYGTGDTGLQLNLVYNPLGPSLPPSQEELEKTYKSYLEERYNIRFNRLYTLANMPIKRFGSTLVSRGQFREYLSLLKSAHREENLDEVMCRDLISIDWQGYAYDCDFNQMLGLGIRANGKRHTHLSELMHMDVTGWKVTVRDHCYGCTAGQGSSCGGALKK